MLQVYHTFSFSGLLSQTAYPDLFLTAADGEEREVPAHRVVLAAVSDKLAVLCQEGGRIRVRNINFQVLEMVIRFVYSGKILLDSLEEVEDLNDGMDMLKIKIGTRTDKICNTKQEIDKKELIFNPKEVNKDSKIKDANIVVETTFSLTEENWCENNMVGEEVKALQSSISVGKLNEDEENFSEDGNETVDGVVALEDLGSSESRKPLELRIKPKFSGSAKKPFRYSIPSHTSEIQKQAVVCDYCGHSLLYKSYVKHCKMEHPTSPWDVKRKCGTCKNIIPEVIFNHHLKLFAHQELKEVHENLVDESESRASGESYPNYETLVKNKKQQTRVPCDYCEEQVPLMRYVSHCKKLHSISDSNERCRKKCYKCGAKVHIVAEKFHDQIYHPAQPKHVTGKSEPLEIVDHNKNLTKIQCDYCQAKVPFSTYKSHVRNKHPEIAYAELVKCRKCGCKVPKISFKFHRLIFHNSNKLKAHPIKPLLPTTKVSCSQCDAKVKPHIMFWHMKTVHGGLQTEHAATDTDESVINHDDKLKFDIFPSDIISVTVENNDKLIQDVGIIEDDLVDMRDDGEDELDVASSSEMVIFGRPVVENPFFNECL